MNFLYCSYVECSLLNAWRLTFWCLMFTSHWTLLICMFINSVQWIELKMHRSCAISCETEMTNSDIQNPLVDFDDFTIQFRLGESKNDCQKSLKIQVKQIPFWFDIGLFHFNFQRIRTTIFILTQTIMYVCLYAINIQILRCLRFWLLCDRSFGKVNDFHHLSQNVK